MHVYSHLINTIYILIIIYFFASTTIATTTKENIDINVVIKEVDYIEAKSIDKKIKITNDFINQKLRNHEKYNNIQINLKLSYCPDGVDENYNFMLRKFIKDKHFIDYLSCVARHLKDPSCDLLITDDKLLLGDTSEIENYIINRIFGRKKSKEYYVNLRDYVSPNDLFYHDENVIKDACEDKTDELYGLPLEIDYNTIFFNSDYVKLRVNTSFILSWDDYINVNSPKLMRLEQRQISDLEPLASSKPREPLASSKLKESSTTSKPKTSSTSKPKKSATTSKPKKSSTTSTSKKSSSTSKSKESLSTSTPKPKESFAFPISKSREPLIIPTSLLKELFVLPTPQLPQLKQLNNIYLNNNNTNSNNTNFNNTNSNNTNFNNTNSNNTNFNNTNSNNTNSNNTNSNYNYLLNIPLKNNEEILKFYLEYTGYAYGYAQFVKHQNVTFKDLLYSENHAKSFRNYLIRNIGSDNVEEIHKAMGMDIEESYKAFINNKISFFKGRYSYKDFLTRENPSVVAILPPNDSTAINERYISINKNSEKDKNFLFYIAQLLSSKEMQTFRCDQFGSLPTFNINSPDPDIEEFCNSHERVCSLIKKTTAIRTKTNFIQYRLSSSIMETRHLIPYILKQFLLDADPSNVVQAFKNIIQLDIFEFDAVWLLVNIIMTIFMIFSFIIVCLVHRHRNHPYLKIVSPSISILAILGLVFNTLSIPFYGRYISPNYCKFMFVLEIMIRDLIYLPMFVIIYRVYYIYSNKSKVNYGKKVNDKRLFTFIGITMMINLIIGLTIIFFKDLYLINVNFNQRSYFRCEFDTSLYYSIAYLFYYFIIVSTHTIS